MINEDENYLKRLLQSLYHEAAGMVSLFYYCRLPSKLRSPISPKVKAISIWSRRIFMLMFQFRRECFMIRGRRKNSEIRILYIGQKARLSYILHLASFEESVIQKQKKIFLWQTGKILRDGRNNSDLVIVEVNPLFAKRARKSGLILVPEWVSFMKTPSALAELIKSSGSIKENMRKVRKYEYSYEISRDFEKLKLFYDEMYVPYISKRHTYCAYIRNFSFVKNLFKAGVLLFVKHKGEYVAGGLLIFRDRALWASCLGILDGDAGYLKRGVISALIYFILKWAGEQKFKTVDFGLTRAFLNDGVFCFKRTWGMAVKEHEYTTTFWGFKVCRFSEGVCNFLENNPFVFYNNGGLEGFAFMKNSSPIGASETQVLYKSFWTKGLSKLNLLSTSGFAKGSVDSECRDLNLVNKDFLPGHKCG